MHRVSVVGTGDLFARTLLPRLEGDSPFEVVAHFGTGLATGERCPSAEQAIEHEKAEVVWLLGPARVHARQAVRALNAGKHVYVQKPLGTNLDEVDELIELSRDSDRKIVAAPVQAAYPTIRRMKEEVALLDEFFFAVIPMMGWGGRDIPWPRDPSWRFGDGGGPLSDHGVYGITTLIEVLGPVRRVVAMGEVRVPERTWQGSPFPVTELDNLAAVLELERGGYATLHEGWCAGVPNAEFRFHGLSGSITAFGDMFDACPRGFVVRETWGAETRRVDASSDPEIAKFFADDLPNPHVWADLLHLADCISGAESLATPARVRPVYATIRAIREAAMLGHAVEVAT